MSSEKETNKLLDKLKDTPTVPLGITGLIGVVAYGIYNFKNRKESISLYLIQLRVLGQGTLVGCMSLGIMYTVYQKLISKSFSEKKN